MNMRWLILFSAVAEEGSFTRAANRLNVAQPWVSAQIRKLETELGVDLIERTKSGILLTREGRELLPYATQVAEGARRFRDLARTMGDIRSKTVRVGSHLPVAGLKQLKRLTVEYQRRYPHFIIDTERDTTPALLAALHEGTIDCAACLGPIEDMAERYEAVTVGQSMPFLLSAYGVIDDSSIEGMRVDTPDRALQPTYFDPIYAHLRERGAELRPVPEAGSDAMVHHARRKQGAVLMTEGDAADFDSDSLLTATPLDEEPAITLLLRVKGRDSGRAALRYWEVARTATAH